MDRDTVLYQQVRDLRIDGKYQLVRKLGSGASGVVYRGRDVETGEEVAIKLENETVDPSMLETEIDAYQAVAGQPGFAQVYWHGALDDYRVMVFELLGPTLADVFRYCGNRFSLKTTLMLADQLLCRFEALHSQNLLHRDIRPDNFLLGLGGRGNVVYLSDLGIAHDCRREAQRPRHPPAPRVSTGPPSLVGTCRYASIKGHFCGAIARRDDLEALGYMLIYFVRGRLPWQGIEMLTSTAKYTRVLEMKQNTPVSELCADLPAEFADYLNYLHALPYPNWPDYQFLQQLFKNLFRRQGFEDDGIFDWTLLEFQRLEAESKNQQRLTPDDNVEKAPRKRTSPLELRPRRGGKKSRP